NSAWIPRARRGPKQATQRHRRAICPPAARPERRSRGHKESEASQASSEGDSPGRGATNDVNVIPTVLERHKARRITIFSHKGGVGKTTLAMNIAFALADKGRRALLID